DLAGRIEARLADAEDACRRAVEARKQAEAAQQAEAAARTRLEAARQTLHAAEEQARQASRQQEKLQETQTRLTEEQQRLAATLDRVLGAHLDWQGLAQAGAVVQVQINDWRGHDAACRAAEAALPALRQSLRSEERRVGKECRSPGAAEPEEAGEGEQWVGGAE